MQPTTGLIIGIIILVFIGYMNWRGSIKSNTVKWIAKRIYRDGPMSNKLADGMFMTLTSILLAVGGILVILSLVDLGVL